MKKLKVIAASLAFAFSASSHAALSGPQDVGTGSSLFLVAWVDGVVTYARNLGLTMSSLLNSPVTTHPNTINSAWTSESGALFNSTTNAAFGADANWTAATSVAGFNFANVQWNIATAEQLGGNPGLMTTFDGATAFTSPGNKGNGAVNTAAGRAGTYAAALQSTVAGFNPGEPNCSGASNSCYTTQTTGPAFSNTTNWEASWAGTLATTDSAAESSEGISFWYYGAANSIAAQQTTPVQFRNSANAGFWFLEADGDVRYELAAVVAEVPVPGALWLLLSGLLGLTAVSRRRKTGLLPA